MENYRAESDDDFSDGDEDKLFSRDVRNESQPPKQWDIFEDNPPENETLYYEEQKLYQYTIKVLKILTYIGAFLIILVTSVISKITLLLMTSQLDLDAKTRLCFETSRRKREVDGSLHERIQWCWAIYFCFMIPEIQTFWRSFRIAVFKGPPKPKVIEFVVPFIFEVLHTIGLGLLVFAVLPEVHAVKASMLGNAVCLVPVVLSLMSRKVSNSNHRSWMILMLIDGVALILQLWGLVFWPLFFSKNFDRAWLFPVSAFLISLGWWENFVSVHSVMPVSRWLAILRKQVMKTRYHSYLYISVIKMIVFLATMVLARYIVEDGNNVNKYFYQFEQAFESRNLSARELNQTISEGKPQDAAKPDIPTNPIIQSMLPVQVDTLAAVIAFVIQFCAAYLCYFTARFACKIRIQGFSFAFPLCLSVPVTIVTLLSMCSMRADNVCYLSGRSILPGYLFWNCPSGTFKNDFLHDEYGWMWIFLIVSQTWITIHVWFPNSDRLPRTDTIFCRPLYNAFLTDQDLLLNRKQTPLMKEDEDDTHKKKEKDRQYSVPDEMDGYTFEGPDNFNADKVPNIIACATMWHETDDEMIAMFKSVFRMDEDVAARRKLREYFMIHSNYYNYETHIFFDDAFQTKKEDGRDKVVVNDWVRMMIPAIEKAASLVHEVNMKIAPPKKIPTPYGGRLEFLLPGKTKLTVHLKNKDKIRHRKRWSQCMYMYYLLGYRIMNREDLTPERKQVMAHNTFLLALDGDIDFQPHAVELLVDLMKKTENLGAACGRIHPIGEGPMVWYQKFEYAIGHWLQKATEHMIGCVLCSPGCFSLFRAEGLMDDNVMKKYTTEPSQARHYVQYDQGEDRWLCTLLLQQGWRVEYCAASDALTHAPEGFNEFYNQRRRWVPSTMANILDLLWDSRQTIKVNPDISRPYIWYQFILMAGSILGPGTIFLMLVGAFVAAFKVDNYTSFYINLTPLLLFIIVCFFCNKDIQLTLAQILSVIYALVMVAVLIALILQVIEDGPLAPSSIFLIAIALSFIISAILHPLEFGCLLHGILYYITIPSMYLLLIIYSLFNLNDISWGTREVPQTPSQKQEEAAKAQEQQAPKKGKLSFLTGIVPGLGNSKNNSEGSMEFSCAGLFKIMCCVQDKQKDDVQTLVLRLHEDIKKSNKKLDHIEKVMLPTDRRPSVSTSSVGSTHGRNNSIKDMDGLLTRTAPNIAPIVEETHEESSSQDERPEEEERDDLMNPYWIEDRALRKGPVDFLTKKETDFWKEFIKKYLEPLTLDNKQKEKIALELKDLRNRVVGAFFMMNAVFVTALFLLQLNKDKLFFEWPLGGKHNFTYAETNDEIQLQTEYLQLEPLGLLFVGFYAIVLIVQFVGMLFHRFGTYCQIMCHTSINLVISPKKPSEKDMRTNGVKFVREMQKLKTANAESEDGSIRKSTTRRKTIVDLARQKQKPKIATMDKAFQRNFERAAKNLNTSDKGRRMSLLSSTKKDSLLDVMMTRRDTIMQRRNSTLDPRRASQRDPGRRTTFYGDQAV